MLPLNEREDVFIQNKTLLYTENKFYACFSNKKNAYLISVKA